MKQENRALLPVVSKTNTLLLPLGRSGCGPALSGGLEPLGRPLAPSPCIDWRRNVPTNDGERGLLGDLLAHVDEGGPAFSVVRQGVLEGLDLPVESHPHLTMGLRARIASALVAPVPIAVTALVPLLAASPALRTRRLGPVGAVGLDVRASAAPALKGAAVVRRVALLAACRADGLGVVRNRGAHPGVP